MNDTHSIETVFLSSLCDSVASDSDSGKKFFYSTNILDVDFVKRDNYLAFLALKKIADDGLTPGVEVLVHELKSLGATEPMQTAMGVTSGLGFASQVEPLWKRISEESDRRQTLFSLRKAVEQLTDGDGSPSSVRQLLGAKLMAGRSALQARQLTDYLERAVDILQANHSGQRPAVIKTGIQKLDEVICGWQDTLTLIGAEPGVGKSSLMAVSVYEMAKAGIKTAVFSLEDEPTWMAWRLTAKEAKVGQQRLRFSRLSEYEMEKVGEAMSGKLFDYASNIYVVDGSSVKLTLADIAASCHDLIQNKGVRAIFIDHLGEIPTGAGDRPDREIGQQLSELRKLTNKYHVPLIVFAHTRRMPDTRQKDENGLPVPKLSDFAESAYIERMARVAMILTREYGSDKIRAHILKQTNGPAGQVVEMAYDGLASMVVAVEGGYEGPQIRRFANATGADIAVPSKRQ